MVLSAMYLKPLDDRRDTHAAANTQRHQRAPGVAALQLVNHGAQNHRAGSTERMAHGDGTAVDVELLVGDVQVLLELEHYGREGLVELEQVDVVNRETGGVALMAAPAFSLPIATSAAPSTIPEELPPEWTWLIFSTQWYFCRATSSKPPIAARAS